VIFDLVALVLVLALVAVVGWRILDLSTDLWKEGRQ